MRYSILLIFILSCSQSSFVYHILPELRSFNKLTRKNYVHDVQPSNYQANYPMPGASPYPLHNAVSKNELIEVQIILNKDKLKTKYKHINKACIRVDQKDDQGYLPIHWAVDKKFSYKNGKEAYKNLKILELLLKYPSSSQGDNNDMTILHWAAKNNLPHSVKLILKKYSIKRPHFINQKDKKGFTALHYAVDKDEKEKYSEKQRQVLNILLNDPHVDRMATDKDGNTALHWAVKNNNLEALKAILAYSSNAFIDFINQKDEAGFTALHYAVDKDEKRQYSERQLQVLNILLQDPRIDLMERDKDGRTVLHWAVSNNNLEAVKVILQYAQSKLKSYKDFINLKTYIDPASGQGACPAIYWTTSPACSEEDEQASRAISLEIFKLLLPKCAMNEKDNQGNTIAHWVVVRGRNDMLKLLIAHKVDLNVANQKGQTVLHTIITAMDYAMTNRDFLLMQYLYCKKYSILNQLLSLAPSRLDFKKKDQSGYTALRLALKHRFSKEIIEKLEKKEEGALPFKKRKNFKGISENVKG